MEERAIRIKIDAEAERRLAALREIWSGDFDRLTRGQVVAEALSLAATQEDNRARHGARLSRMLNGLEGGAKDD